MDLFGMTSQPGRWSELTGKEEISDLEVGMDFRKPEFRREVFHRLFQFTLKYKIHPGCVYFALPSIREESGLGQEEYLWLCFINGCSQNPITSWQIINKFPSVKTTSPNDVDSWAKENFKKIQFDTDRRFWKIQLANCINSYQQNLGGLAQQEYFDKICGVGSEQQKFKILWKEIRNKFHGMGRLSGWSYIEYLRIAGIPVNSGTLFLEDMSGSKSHRNGLAKVLGRDDLDWHDSNPNFDGKYSKAVLEWLNREADLLLNEAQERSKGTDWEQDTNFLTMESCLCTFKSHFRKNRRYPGVYADMFHDRIKKAEEFWPNGNFNIFWKMRIQCLPKWLRLEDNPRDFGVKPEKQNTFGLTGTLPIIGKYDPVFDCEYNSLLEN